MASRYKVSDARSQSNKSAETILRATGGESLCGHQFVVRATVALGWLMLLQSCDFRDIVGWQHGNFHPWLLREISICIRLFSNLLRGPCRLCCKPVAMLDKNFFLSGVHTPPVGAFDSTLLAGYLD